MNVRDLMRVGPVIPVIVIEGPTGGVTAASAPDFLVLPNVSCVGGSWRTPKDVVTAGDWRAITALAREAAGLRTSAR